MSPQTLAPALEDHRAGRLAQAESAYRHLLSLDPANPGTHHLLGILCHQTGRGLEAIQHLRQAISLDNTVSAYHCNLGMAYAMLNQFPQAIAALDRAIQLQPHSAEAHSNLSNVYKQIGQIERAVDLAQRAAALKKDPRLAGNLLYLLHFHPAYDAAQIAAAHRAWRRTFADPLKQFIRPHANTRDPDRPLKLGFFLPILADHPILRFLLPFLENHTRADFQIVLYHDKGDFSNTKDPAIASILSLPVTCRNTRGLDDTQAAQAIREDRIDILIDLAMHADDNRLLVFAQRPAPVQVTYLAYPGSTGLDTIDYRLTDPFLDPPPFDPNVYAESSMFLETFWCYHAPPQAPPVGPLPASSTGCITFGCLNNYAKVTRAALDLWTAILAAGPDSRLLLYCPEGPGRHRAISFFAESGLSTARLIFRGPMPIADYFAQYNQIDIALDPTPHAGGTTTCDALWMGVPVITLPGKTAVSRAGASLLSNARLPDLIAATPDQYIQLALNLANDLPRLISLRSTLRSRLRASPLMNAPRFTRNLESAFREIWRTWCRGPSAQC